ncbi:MAG: DUF3644 domain-containing protein [Ignavibacteria bacterium]|jgi:hypothetical protein
MSVKKLLTDDQIQTFFEEYHSYISECKKNNTRPILSKFFTRLKKNQVAFTKFTSKQLSNQIIASRRQYGNLLWPNFKDVKNYISPNSSEFVEKSVKSTLLAVEIYNKPTIEYRTEGYIVMMIVAWTSLFHAIFEKDSIKYKYKSKKNKKGQYYELKKCINVYQGILKREIEANLKFLIHLRDLIEHRIIPDLDHEVFGECQACLYNYEKILSENFGHKYQLYNSLAYSLQFSTSYTPEQLKSKKAYDISTIKSVKKFIERYRKSLEPEILQSIHYSFRVFLIPKVGNRIKSSDLAVEFIKYDPQDEIEYESYENLLVLIKDKRATDKFLRAGEVSRQVYDNLKDKKPSNWKFNPSYHHNKCAKYFKIRVGHYSDEPEKTDEKYCIYDSTFKQYKYRTAWVKFLIDKLSDDVLYKNIMKSN